MNPVPHSGLPTHTLTVLCPISASLLELLLHRPVNSVPTPTFPLKPLSLLSSESRALFQSSPSTYYRISRESRASRSHLSPRQRSLKNQENRLQMLVLRIK